jgi:hypothetical protein
MKIHSAILSLLQAGKWADGQTDRHMAKLIGAFLQPLVANMPENAESG